MSCLTGDGKVARAAVAASDPPPPRPRRGRRVARAPPPPTHVRLLRRCGAHAAPMTGAVDCAAAFDAAAMTGGTADCSAVHDAAPMTGGAVDCAAVHDAAPMTGGAVDCAAMCDASSMTGGAVDCAAVRDAADFAAVRDAAPKTGAVDNAAARDAAAAAGSAARDDVGPSPERVARESAPPGWLAALRALPKVYGLTDAERARIRERNARFDARDVPPSGLGGSLANGVVIAVVALASKAYMRGLNDLRTYRLRVLTDAVEARPPGVGLLTVSNHRSVADDPIMLSAILPPRILLRPRLMRWGMCSVDICFQSAAMARFITLGKALPVKRFGGIGHPFVLAAAEKLAAGDWLHMYPEGRVVQRGLGYMKRGVGKMLAIAHERAAEAQAESEAAADAAAGAAMTATAVAEAPAAAPRGLPIVLPIYHEGVENVMPQDPETHMLFGIVPRVGQRVFTIIGDPLDMCDIFAALMPPCAAAGGTRGDAPECVRLYEAVSDRCTEAIRLLRAELRMRVRVETGLFLGDPYECT